MQIIPPTTVSAHRTPAAEKHQPPALDFRLGRARSMRQMPDPARPGCSSAEHRDRRPRARDGARLYAAAGSCSSSGSCSGAAWLSALGRGSLCATASRRCLTGAAARPTSARSAGAHLGPALAQDLQPRLGLVERLARAREPTLAGRRLRPLDGQRHLSQELEMRIHPRQPRHWIGRYHPPPRRRSSAGRAHHS